MIRLFAPVNATSVARVKPGIWLWAAYEGSQGWHSALIASGRAPSHYPASRQANAAAGGNAVRLDPSFAASVDGEAHCFDEREGRPA